MDRSAVDRTSTPTATPAGASSDAGRSVRPMGHWRTAAAQAGVVVASGACMAAQLWLLTDGNVIAAATVAALSVPVGLALAAASEGDALEGTGVGLAALSMMVVATAVAPAGAPEARLMIAAVAVAPFAFARARSTAPWWRAPAPAVPALAAALVVGLGFGFAGVTAGAPVEWSAGDATAFVAFALLGGAVVEEVVYRGAVLDGLGGGTLGVVGSAALYGLAASGAGDGQLVVVAVLMGLALGALRRLTGSLWTPVLVHLVVQASILWLWR